MRGQFILVKELSPAESGDEDRAEALSRARGKVKRKKVSLARTVASTHQHRPTFPNTESIHVCVIDHGSYEDRWITRDFIFNGSHERINSR